MTVGIWQLFKRDVSGSLGGGKLELTFFERLKLWGGNWWRQFWAIKNRFLCSSSFSSSTSNKGDKGNTNFANCIQYHPMTTMVKTDHRNYLWVWCVNRFNLLGCKFLGMLGVIVYQEVKGLQGGRKKRQSLLRLIYSNGWARVYPKQMASIALTPGPRWLYCPDKGQGNRPIPLNPDFGGSAIWGNSRQY